MALMFQGHAQQFRKSTEEPYAIHPLRVATDVVKYCGSKTNEAVLCAALTHDLIEDTSIVDGVIRRELGEDVANLVTSVTKWWPDSTPIDEKRELKKVYYARIAESPETILLKLIDRMDNMRDMRRVPANDWNYEYYIKTRREFQTLLASPHAYHENLIDDFMDDFARLWLHVRDHNPNTPSPDELFRASKFVIDDDQDPDDQFSESGSMVWRTRVCDILSRAKECADADAYFGDKLRLT